MPARPLPGHGAISHSERRLLQGLYQSGSSAYGSVKSLVQSSGLSKRKVLEFLHGKKAYTKYKLPRRRFDRLNVIVKYIDEIWYMDLAHMDKLAKENNGVKYLLVSIDVLSRFVRVQPMKDKTAAAAKAALIKMLNTTKPRKIRVDDGTEFEASFKRYCKEVDITIYHTFSDTKAAYAERAIRSLKSIIYRYLEEHETSKYVNQLQSFVKTMNSRVNRSINMAPKDFTNTDALLVILETLKSAKKPRYKIDEYVRISKSDIPFRKGYKPQFTNEFFKIIDIPTLNPPTYTLQDKDKEIIRGKFYEPELIKYTI